jgi:hypothetical protein
VCLPSLGLLCGLGDWNGGSVDKEDKGNGRKKMNSDEQKQQTEQRVEKKF